MVYQHEDSPTQAISEAVAEATTNVLKTVIADGGATGYYAHVLKASSNYSPTSSSR